ncbi:MAG: PEP-CTERM sorting domain-containing protein [Syntrophobacteraceae bacterium]|jgi:uncharacterized membrane protein
MKNSRPKSENTMNRVITLAAALLLGMLALVPYAIAQSYTFTPLSDPAGQPTIATGINNIGQVVGYYGAGATWSGFIYNKGVFSTLDYPGVTASGYTEPWGINDKGQVVGIYNLTSHGPDGTYGYIYSGGIFTTINFPESTFTFAYGINDRGQIVGFNGEYSFIYSGGVFTTLDDPLGQVTIARDINSSGQIVGDYIDLEGEHGFIYSGGVFTTLDDPSVTAGMFTVATGINDRGQVVGYYQDTELSPYVPSSYGFIYNKGVFSTLDYPSSPITFLDGINDLGQIVGVNTTGSFIANPVATPVPEPSTILLLGSGLVGLVGWRWRRK